MRREAKVDDRDVASLRMEKDVFWLDVSMGDADRRMNGRSDDGDELIQYGRRRFGRQAPRRLREDVRFEVDVAL